METLSVQSRDREKRAVGRALRVALIASVAMAAVLVALLATASGNTYLMQRHYGWLFTVTAGLAVALLCLVIELVRRLAHRYRAGLFGTRLMMRLAWSFTLMTVIPGLLIYLVSVQFVGRSIESWFDLPLERALDSGLSLGRASLDASLADLADKARRFDAALADVPVTQWSAVLNRLRDQTGVQEAVIVGASGRVIANAGAEYGQLLPDVPSAAVLRQARLMRQYAVVEGGDTGSDTASSAERALRLRVVRLLAPGASLSDEQRFLQLTQRVPTEQANDAETVLAAQRDYQVLKSSRQSLKKLFVVALTLALVLTLFSAIAAAFLLSGWLTGPLSMLAAGTRAVAVGDFRPVKDYGGRDELGVLTQSFNAMTRQLDEARAQVARKQQQLEQTSARLERVLSNLTAGVLAFDAQFRLTLANPGAQRIFGASLDERLGELLEALPRLRHVATLIRDAFAAVEADDDQHRTWQRQIELPRSDSAAGTAAAGTAAAEPAQTLLARGSLLPGAGAPDGYLLVLDDISDVISAQRAIAWGEVAQRLAHEIKNPLTPIQLAAERLEIKLADKLPAQDAELLRRNSRTIVNQVGALKHMVDEFRDYARLPSAQLHPLDLNALVAEVLTLYGSGGGGAARIVTQLTPAMPAIIGDATQLRQVIHNLVRNALDAVEKLPDACVWIVTETTEAGAAGASGRTARGVRLIVRDNGPGFTPKLLARAFEPYVTSKSRGTGLGLAIVKKIVDEHGARIEIINHPSEPPAGAATPMAAAPGAVARGAAVTILFTKLADSADNLAASARRATERSEAYGRDTGRG